VVVLYVACVYSKFNIRNKNKNIYRTGMENTNKNLCLLFANRVKEKKHKLSSGRNCHWVDRTCPRDAGVKM